MPWHRERRVARAIDLHHLPCLPSQRTRPHADDRGDPAMTRRPPRGILSHPAFRAAMAVLSVWCMAPGGCGGGGGGQSGSLQPQATVPATPNNNVSPNLTASDVNTIVLQAINEAAARGKPATIAIVDRVGNVLSVTQMPGAPAMSTVE